MLSSTMLKFCRATAPDSTCSIVRSRETGICPSTRVQLALDRDPQRHRIGGGPDRPRQRKDVVGERRQPFGHLALRHVHHADVRVLQPVLAHVADDPDDLPRRLLELRPEPLADDDQLPDRILLRPVLLRHRLVDDDDPRRPRRCRRR